MFFKRCCFCLKPTENTDSIPTNETSCGGVNNKSFEIESEPVEQQNASDHPPKLSKSSSSSFESIKLSKIDLKLNIFENDRFSDMAETIHKNNAQNL